MKRISVFRSVLDSIASFGGGDHPKRPLRGRLLPILAVLGNLVLALSLCSPAFGQATGNTTIQPDCLIPFTFAAAGSFPATSVTGGAGDNRTKGCAAWTLMYQNTGMTSVSVTLQSGSTPGTSPSYGAFAGTISSGYANPIVSDTGGSLQATNGTADISWVRVNVAATGTGTLTGVLYGFRNTSAAVNLGALCPSGAAGDIQFTDGTNCVGSADLTWNNTGKILQMRGVNGVAFLHLDGANTGANSFIIEPTPVSVASASGSTGNDLSLESGDGGATSNAGTGTGGDGGTYYIFGGDGGAAASALTSSTGGNGGDFELLTGVGANATTAATNTGGNGGDLSLSANAGGTASGGSSNSAGRGGNFFISGANGGGATGPALSTNVGGNAGAFEIDTGFGGNASGGSSNTGGNGSDFVIGLGTGGTGSTANGTDGSFRITHGFGATLFTLNGAGFGTWGGVAFASLGTPSNGTEIYCTNCTITSGSDNTCATSGAGAWAFRLNGAWKCVQ